MDDEVIAVYCTIPDTVKVMGIPSHTEYIFNNSNNHVVFVYEQDWPDLEKKTRTQGCCGNKKTTFNVFVKL